MHLSEKTVALLPSVFSRSMSQMIKGIAILMMIAHHCFAFPEYWLDDFQASLFLEALGDQFKICVAIFAFITGYGFCVGRRGTYRDSLRKTMVFLGQYWLQLFLIFLPVASLSYRFSAKRILYNMIALNDNIIIFAWYVFFHCLVMLTFPLVRKMLNGKPVRDLAVVLLGGYCVTVFFYFQPLEGPLFSLLIDCSIYYPVVGIGYLSAKYAVFDRLEGKVPTVAAVMLLPVILLLRSQLSVIKGFTFDVLYAPLFILAMCRILKKCRMFHAVLLLLGKHSFHMWLFHSIFFSAYTRVLIQPLVSWTDLASVRFLLVAAVSAVAALIIDKVWNICTTVFVSD